MIKNYFLFVFTLSTFIAFSQDTYTDVYAIFQNRCMPCHNTATQTANLDLEGSGATIQAKMANVYAALYKQNPNNSTATASKNYLVYPGDPYRSYLYRKMDNNLTPGLSLHAGEGVFMPQNATIPDQEIEMVRQWVLYGAQETGTYFDKNLLIDYFTNGGVESVTNPPLPPAAGEGFQIHLGPFFLEPNGEIEYFSKYEPKFDSDLEIHKIQTEMGSFSHHYIVYKFSSTLGNLDPNTVPYGMRPGQDFDSREFVSVDQYSNTLSLPQGSAFKWEQNTILDLNTHYINYSSTQVLKCEVYYNVYTQDVGTANQEMQVILVPNTNIPIPNNNVPVTFVSDFELNANVEVYVWGLIAHTHKYGKDFNIYKKNPNGSRGVQIYDGGCSSGIPGCTVEDFDYSHLPLKLNYPFLPVNVQQGLEVEATYQNDGPVSVNWGFTSDDEMMIFVALFVADTTGVDMSGGGTTAINDKKSLEEITVYPNPAQDYIFIENNSKSSFLSIYDIAGKEIMLYALQEKNKIDISKWTNGLYFYRIYSEQKTITNGKFVKE